MNFIITKFLLLCLFGQLFSQVEGNFLEIGNELLVRKKLITKLPDVFDDKKFVQIATQLDNIASIDPKSHTDRLDVLLPEFHWCFAQAYLLVNMPTESLDHYRQYKIQLLDNYDSTQPFFLNNVEELETALENQQLLLAKDIILTINDFKSMTAQPEIHIIKTLQNKLNAYNEINSSYTTITIDGVIGPETKSAIYDFEESSNSTISQGEIENNTSNVPLEISSMPPSIRPVSQFNSPPSLTENTPNLTIDKSIKLSDKIILDAEKIKSIPGNSIAEILEHVLGLNVRRSGASDVLATVSTLGGTSEQTLILVDGLKMSNQQTLHHDLDLPINIDDIEQIEILHSAAARIYGTGAVSGIINIVTKNGQNKQSYLATEFGDYSLVNGNVAINIPIGKSYHNISYSDIYSVGHQTNSDLLKRTFYYKYSLTDGKSSTNFSFGHLIRGNGIINGVSNIYQNQYERNSTKFFNSKILWDFNDTQLESNMYWFDHQDELAYNQNIGGWQDYSNTEIGVNFFAKLNSKLGYTQPAFNYSRETNSNSTVKDIIRDQYSLTIQHDFSINKLNIGIGMSGNYYADFGWFNAPGYMLSYNINNNANIYHKLDHGFRIPSFYEMHANDYIYNGNDDLKEESISSFENGMQLYGSAMSLTISQFYKNNKNVIDWYPIRNVWNATNIPNVIISGNHLRAELYPKIINLLKFIDRFEIGYAFMDIEHNGDKSEYKNLSHYLRHQITYGVKYKLPFGISRSWHVRYEQPVAFSNRTIIDTQIHHKIWKIESTLNISNLFDVQYQDIEDVSLPGRWIRFSLRFNL